MCSGERENGICLFALISFYRYDVLFVFFIKAGTSGITNDVTLQVEVVPKCLDIDFSTFVCTHIITVKNSREFSATVCDPTPCV